MPPRISDLYERLAGLSEFRGIVDVRFLDIWDFEKSRGVYAFRLRLFGDIIPLDR